MFGQRSLITTSIQKHELTLKMKDDFLSGTERWRADGRCGDQFSHIVLHDGSFAECNPDGKYPCCNKQMGDCWNDPFYCDCPDCVDYRVVRSIRESGRSCDVMQRGGFFEIRLL